MSTGIFDGVSPPGEKDSGAVSVPPSPRRRRVLVGAVVALGLVLVAAVITGLALGARYQPSVLATQGAASTATLLPGTSMASPR